MGVMMPIDCWHFAHADVVHLQKDCSGILFIEPMEESKGLVGFAFFVVEGMYLKW